MQNPEKPIYAEDVNYWKTGSRTSCDEWIEKTKREILAVGGAIIGSGTAINDMTGRAAFTIRFRLEEELFDLRWPVLETKTMDLRAARVQSATALYHDVKACCLRVKFLGARAAFLAYLILPDGSTASEVTSGELLAGLPRLLVADTQMV